METMSRSDEGAAAAQRPWVRPLADAGAGIAEVGGKGASLARLAAAGLPVPDGFHLTTAAYDAFVDAYALRPRIDALAGARSGDTGDQDDADVVQRSSAAIRALFDEHPVPAEIRAAAAAAYADLGEPAVAVRSSATAEDLPGHSFAGQQDTVVNVRGLDDVLDAVRRCWASLWTARALAYRRRAGLDTGHLALAVVVQRMVDAEAAGVLFTADPVTGHAERVWINAAYGLGEAVVGGHVTPDTYVLTAGGVLVDQRIHDKSLMVVPTPDGTAERDVPADRRARPTLTREQAEQLAALGSEVAALMGHPVDVEWALDAGRFWLLQARPITAAAEPVTAPTRSLDPWNDAREVAYAWTNTNVGEAIPDVMTPATWWLVRAFLAEALPTGGADELWVLGRIGGRLYVNLSRLQAITSAAGIGEDRFRRFAQEVFGRLPDDLPIPTGPIPTGAAARWATLRRLAPMAARMLVHGRRDLRGLDDYLRDHAARCRALRDRIDATHDARRLLDLWRRELAPAFRESGRMLSASMRSSGLSFVTIRARLRDLVGERDANALTAGHGRELASLALLLGLDRLASGAIDLAGFNDTYGHRGPHELEVSLPRPGEDEAWVRDQLAAQRDGPGARELLRRRRTAYEAAWARLRQDHPLLAPRIAHRLRTWAAISRQREAARGETVRMFWVVREYLLRAGELTGLGHDIFFLGLDEVAGVLAGHPPPRRRIDARRAAYERYRELPPLPSLISGRFDPFTWAADPARRSDVYVDGADRPTPVRATITGFGGSSGVVEGRARVLADMDGGAALEPGEILVTPVTNVGWTPLFPRAGAVVTDVGAPLSHAAIVARELGIPAVVGCGDATMRIGTGDLLRVDGGAGTVELLAPAA